MDGAAYLQTGAVLLEKVRAFIVVRGTHPAKILCMNMSILAHLGQEGEDLTFAVPLEKTSVVAPSSAVLVSPIQGRRGDPLTP
jgi:hypothetical protein